jgi:hypothetical protein
MKRFRLWLYNGLAAISLLIFLGGGTGWILSYFRTDLFCYPVLGDPRLAKLPYPLIFFKSRGEMLIGSGYASDDVTAPQSVHSTNPVLSLGQVIWLFIIGDRMSTGGAFAGFGYLRQTDAMQGEHAGIAIVLPYWAVAFASSALPAVWLLARLRKQRRTAFQLCPHCRYDLRATPDRCPECGTIPLKKEITPT